MIKKIIKKMAMVAILFFAGYLAVGYLLHLVLFPEKKPAVSDYFKPGQHFYSKKEGFRQTVVAQEKGRVYCSLEVDPFAGGPPRHIHTDFDETFEVMNGELSVWIDGKVVKVKPGDKVFVPRGTPHKPFNETAETIYLKGAVAFPEKFAYYLPQVYGFMDNTPGFEKSPATALQMSMFTSEGFDSYAADGPPVPLQKVISFLLVPLNRLLGYKSFYRKYDINNRAEFFSRNN